MVELTKSVSAEFLVDAGQPGRTRRTVLQLEWLHSDPICVHLRLSTQPDHPALPRGSWQVLRDFLRYGLDESTGDGSVRISPRRGGKVCLDLSTEGRTTSIDLARDMVLHFLDATERIEPSGAAGEAAVLDALVARLLASEQQ